ncbi:MAG: hypothetical protein WBB23_06920 [Desulforhopalus sp.]
MLLDDFKVPGKRLIVKGNMEFRTEDIAGETSGSDLVEKGIKPKVLHVSACIPYTNDQGLRDLVKTAELKNDSGEQQIYTITDKTANAAGIRQVRFIEHLKWEEAEILRMWNVSFALQEYMSNPERAENRKDSTTPATTSSKYSQVAAQAEKL